MSVPKAPNRARLIIGIILKDKSLLETVSEKLIEQFGALDLISSWFAFDYTGYYEAEMGTGLFRRMLVFKRLISQEDLSSIKIITNRIESDHLAEGKRIFNLDPGYLLLERFVLATGKNYAHRIYIGKGIYADLTLIYIKGGYQTLPWTYPDYTQSEIRTFLEKVRAKYKLDLQDTN